MIPGLERFPEGGQGFQLVLVVKNLPANTGDLRGTGSIPGSGRPLEKEMATRLENSIDRGAW